MRGGNMAGGGGGEWEEGVDEWRDEEVNKEKEGRASIDGEER